MPASMLFINRQPVGGSQDILPAQYHLHFIFLATTRFAIPLGPLAQKFLWQIYKGRIGIEAAIKNT